MKCWLQYWIVSDIVLSLSERNSHLKNHGVTKTLQKDLSLNLALFI